MCTHVREELYDVFSIVQLIGCFLLQEGESGMKQKATSHVLLSAQHEDVSPVSERVLPTNVKTFTQNGHVLSMILDSLGADVQDFGYVCELLQKLPMHELRSVKQSITGMTETVSNVLTGMELN